MLYDTNLFYTLLDKKNLLVITYYFIYKGCFFVLEKKTFFIFFSK